MLQAQLCSERTQKAQIRLNLCVREESSQRNEPDLENRSILTKQQN